MGKFPTWAMMAAGVWMLGAALGYAAGETDPIPPPQPPQEWVRPAVLEGLAPIDEGEPELVTPPLVAGCGSSCNACAPACRTHRLCEWLTYSSSRPGLCHCCPEWERCCRPPLYAYFPCAEGCDTTAHASSGIDLRGFAQRLVHPRCWGIGLRELGARLEYQKPSPPGEMCETK